MRTIDVPSRDLDGPQGITRYLDELARRRVLDDAAAAAAALDGRRIWHVTMAEHSSLTDGVLGVSVLLRNHVPLMRAAGVDVRWLQTDAEESLVDLSWRLHHMLHGRRPGEDAAAPLGAQDSADYERELAEDAQELADLVQQGDLVVLHDPGTVGLARAARAAGAKVIFRCHVGTDVPDETSDAAWAFLAPHLEHCSRVIVSRQAYAPAYLENVAVLTPAITPSSPTNAEMDSATVRDMVRVCGAVAGGTPEMAASFTRTDGTEHLVRHDTVRLVAGDPVPEGARMVLQVGRWDRWKDPAGVLMAWEEGIDRLPDDAHLLLAGPEPTPGSDPGRVLRDLRELWTNLDPEVRSRTHVIALPMDDEEENAALVNALQRHAAVISQKSIAEGWGLTVTEAMAKGKPVVASAVGGINDQITDQKDGLLLEDPHDLAGFVDLVASLLDDERWAAELGRAAELQVRTHHLPDRWLAAWWNLFVEVGQETGDEEPQF